MSKGIRASKLTDADEITAIDRFLLRLWGGIPQIVLLDKQGIVRLILTGWSPDNERRTTRLIQQLLKEPAATSQQ